MESAAQRPGMLDAQNAELVLELLQRWDTLEAPARTSLARQLLMRHGADAAAVTQAGDGELRARLERLGNTA